MCSSDLPLRNRLVVKVEDLLAKMEIFDDGRTAGGPILSEFWSSDTGPPYRSGQHRHVALSELVQFVSLATIHLLIVDGRRPGRSRFAICAFG